jgi:N6-L-threonylcarbamoyladenine synthase
MKILAIETSCDETAASIVEIKNSRLEILSNIVASQIKIHANYGGIVPEIAARKHAENIIPVIDEALRHLKNPRKSAFSEINAIAVTQGPGLITSLRIGVDAARTLSYAWGKPLIPVNHIIAHIYANWLTTKFLPQRRIPRPIGGQFPILCLVVSGGHTMLILMKGHGKFEIIGQTLDDAAGECFDKVAKILKLGYPGGPAIAERAANSKSQIPNSKIELPRPMINSNDFNFSFSGLKTAVLYKVRNMKSALYGISAAGARRSESASTFITQMAYETQNAIVDVLISKTIKAAKKYNVKTIMLGGGVAANKELRKRMEETIKKELPKTLYLTPEISLCTDNAAMVAAAAYFNPKKIRWDKIEPDPNLQI